MDLIDVTVCSLCGSRVPEDAGFCCFCGSPYIPLTISQEAYSSMGSCIYGPPMKCKHICPKCNYKWTEDSLGSAKERYCPKCGATVQDELISYGW